jgi:hypothetical protein
MEENESILDFFTRVIIRFVNQIMVCGEVITTKLVIVKILRSLTPKFNYLVGRQEEFLNLIFNCNVFLDGFSNLLRAFGFQ